MSFLRSGFNRITFFYSRGLFYPTMKFFDLPAILKMVDKFIVVSESQVISSQIFNVSVCVDYLTYQNKSIFLQPDFSYLFIGKPKSAIEI